MVVLHLDMQLKQTVLNFRLLIQRNVQFNFLKKGLALLSPPLFLHHFSRKIFLMFYSINWPNFTVWLPLFLVTSSNMGIIIVCSLVCDVINFKIDLSFLIKLFSYMTEKPEEKIYVLEKKELSKWNKKHFWLFLKDAQLPEIVLYVRVFPWQDHLQDSENVLENFLHLFWEKKSSLFLDNVAHVCYESLFFWSNFFNDFSKFFWLFYIFRSFPIFFSQKFYFFSLSLCSISYFFV